MTPPSSIRIRPAIPSDEGFLVDLIPRLRAFGPGPLRPPEAMDRAEQDAVRRALTSPSSETLLLVAEAAEGKGVGQSLMAAVEEWARDRGYRFLTLNVFDGNRRAKAIYAKAGYRPDAIKYLKVLGDYRQADDP